jgi:hypothetical protein
MKPVGKFKGKNIRLTHLYLKETYGESLVYPAGPGIEIINETLINKSIPRRITELFGQDRPLCIAEKEKIDYRQELPPVTAFAWLLCPQPVKSRRSDGSHLVLVYFQRADEDPFSVVEDKLKLIDWQRYADDFDF